MNFFGTPSLFHKFVTTLCALFPAFHFDITKMSLAPGMEHKEVLSFAYTNSNTVHVKNPFCGLFYQSFWSELLVTFLQC